MKFHFYVNQNFKWVHILQDLITEYNNDYHRTIRMKPRDVTPANQEGILKLLQSGTPNKTNSSDIQVGTRVRITRQKKTFGNKYRENWTKEIFIVDKIVYTEPLTYKLRALDGEEIIGSFYRKELLKSAL